jgi:MoaA/NifB/PqqE/SkfB family radical SAM enzyme
LRGLLLSREQLDSFVNSIDSVIPLYRDQIAPWQREILDLNLLRRRALNSVAHRGYYQTDFIDSIPCYMGWAETRILANGDVCPCCKADRHPLGNIHNASFRDIWDSPQYNEFRQRAKMLSKGDAYFNRIECGRACDDWGLNEFTRGQYLLFLERLKGLGRWERLFWNLMVRKRCGTGIAR